jgi:hypothetical protein
VRTRDPVSDWRWETWRLTTQTPTPRNQCAQGVEEHIATAVNMMTRNKHTSLSQSMMRAVVFLILVLTVAVVGDSEGIWTYELHFGGQTFSFPPSWVDGRSDTDSGVFFGIYSRPEGAPPLEVNRMPHRGCGPYQGFQTDELSVPIVRPQEENPTVWDAEGGYRCWTVRGLELAIDAENARRIADNWMHRVEYLEQLLEVKEPIRPELVEMPYSIKGPNAAPTSEMPPPPRPSTKGGKSMPPAL